MNRKPIGRETGPMLVCPECGEGGPGARFSAIMAFEAHLVTHDLNYVRLLHSEVDRYECLNCGCEDVPVIEVKENE